MLGSWDIPTVHVTLEQIQEVSKILFLPHYWKRWNRLDSLSSFSFCLFLFPSPLLLPLVIFSFSLLSGCPLSRFSVPVGTLNQGSDERNMTTAFLAAALVLVVIFLFDLEYSVLSVWKSAAHSQAL